MALVAVIVGVGLTRAVFGRHRVGDEPGREGLRMGVMDMAEGEHELDRKRE